MPFSFDKKTGRTATFTCVVHYVATCQPEVNTAHVQGGILCDSGWLHEFHTNVSGDLIGGFFFDAWEDGVKVESHSLGLHGTGTIDRTFSMTLSLGEWLKLTNKGYWQFYEKTTAAYNGIGAGTVMEYTDTSYEPSRYVPSFVVQIAANGVKSHGFPSASVTITSMSRGYPPNLPILIGKNDLFDGTAGPGYVTWDTHGDTSDYISSTGSFLSFSPVLSGSVSVDLFDYDTAYAAGGQRALVFGENLPADGTKIGWFEHPTGDPDPTYGPTPTSVNFAGSNISKSFVQEYFGIFTVTSGGFPPVLHQAYRYTYQPITVAPLGPAWGFYISPEFGSITPAHVTTRTVDDGAHATRWTGPAVSQVGSVTQIGGTGAYRTWPTTLKVYAWRFMDITLASVGSANRTVTIRDANYQLEWDIVTGADGSFVTRRIDSMAPTRIGSQGAWAAQEADSVTGALQPLPATDSPYQPAPKLGGFDEFGDISNNYDSLEVVLGGTVVVAQSVPSGVRAIPIENPGSLAIGDAVTLGSGGTADSGTVEDLLSGEYLILSVPTVNAHSAGDAVNAGVFSALTLPAGVGTSTLTVSSTAGMADGDPATIDQGGANQEVVQIHNVLSPTQVSLLTPLTIGHNAGEVLVDTAASGSAATKLSASILAGVKALPVTTSAGFNAGDTPTVGTGGSSEGVTVSEPKPPGLYLLLAAVTAHAHGIGELATTPTALTIQISNIQMATRDAVSAIKYSAGSLPDGEILWAYVDNRVGLDVGNIAQLGTLADVVSFLTAQAVWTITDGMPAPGVGVVWDNLGLSSWLGGGIGKTYLPPPSNTYHNWLDASDVSGAVAIPAQAMAQSIVAYGGCPPPLGDAGVTTFALHGAARLCGEVAGHVCRKGVMVNGAQVKGYYIRTSPDYPGTPQFTLTTDADGFYRGKLAAKPDTNGYPVGGFSTDVELTQDHAGHRPNPHMLVGDGGHPFVADFWYDETVIVTLHGDVLAAPRVGYWIAQAMNGQVLVQRAWRAEMNFDAFSTVDPHNDCGEPAIAYNPDNRRLDVFYMVYGSSGRSPGIWRAWSDDDGVSWVSDPANPLYAYGMHPRAVYNERTRERVLFYADTLASPVLVWCKVYDAATDALIGTYQVTPTGWSVPDGTTGSPTVRSQVSFGALYDPHTRALEVGLGYSFGFGHPPIVFRSLDDGRTWFQATDTGFYSGAAVVPVAQHARWTYNPRTRDRVYTFIDSGNKVSVEWFGPAGVHGTPITVVSPADRVPFGATWAHSLTSLDAVSYAAKVLQRQRTLEEGASWYAATP